jgi:hypothetical protein
MQKKWKMMIPLIGTLAIALYGVAADITVDDKSIGTATYTLTQDGTDMTLTVDKLVTTTSGSTSTGQTAYALTINGGTLTNAIQATGSTITRPLVKDATITNATLQSLIAMGSGVIGDITNLPAGVSSTQPVFYVRFNIGTNYVAIPAWQVGAP